MKPILTPIIVLFSFMMASAQTSENCNADNQLLITDALRSLQDTPVYVNSNPLDLCINSLIFFNVDDIGVLSFSSSGTYPFMIEVTDMVTHEVATLRNAGDETIINKNQLYFFKLTPLAVGTGEVTLTPNALLADALDMPPEVMDVEILSALPVGWSGALEYATVKNTHTFSWGISAQEDVANYYLETSMTGGEFEVVNTISPKPFEGGELFYETESVARMQDAYYRIRQVDFDGRSNVSNVVLVPGQSVGGISLYPNPAQGLVRVAGLNSDSQVQLLSASGQVVRVFAHVSEHEALDVSGIKPGIYTLRALGGGQEAESVRLVVW